MSVELVLPVPGERVYECGAGPAWAEGASEFNGMVGGDQKSIKKILERSCPKSLGRLADH